MDRYNEMLVFIRAVEDGGFSAAGRNLSRTPSAVSKLIARIEERLGVMLFHRSHRTPALTREGEAYYAAALRAVEAVEEAETTVRLRSGTDEILRVRSMPTFATAQLAPLIPSFRRENPALQLEIQLSIEPGNLLEGGIDVAIHVGHLEDSALVARRLTSTRWIICASPDYLRDRGTPQTPDELARHTCLNFVSSLRASHWLVKSGANQSRRIRVTGDFVTNQGQMLLEMARAGAGIVRLAEFHVVQDLLSGRLVELFPDHQSPEEDPIYAVYQGKRHLSHRVRAFLDFLNASFPDDPPPWRRVRTDLCGSRLL